jgi:hypothetical protein
MTKKPGKNKPLIRSYKITGYESMLTEVAALLESARRASVRATNAIMTATYWEIGRRIVEFEQGGGARAEYGKELLSQLSADLTAKFGRGFSVDNLETMRLFYRAYSSLRIENATASSPVKSETVSRKFISADFANRFLLPWSHYALEGLPNKVLAAEYRTALPDEKTLVAEIEKTRRMLEISGILRGK